MSDDKKLDDIILFPGSVSELREVMRDANVKIASLQIVRRLPNHSSLVDAEHDFRKFLAEQGFCGVIHYHHLIRVYNRQISTYSTSYTRTDYGCQGIPITIKPPSYRD